MVAWIGPAISAIANVAGGILGKNAAKGQMKEQERYAKNALSWKVADAKRAGIHPLYALGAQTMSYSPVSVGGEQQAMSAAGQDIGRAVHAVASESERGVAKATAALSLERAGLENELLRSQISRLRQTPNPGLPKPGADPYGQVVPGQNVPAPIKEETKRSGWNPAAPGQESHAVADIGWSKNTDGTWSMVPGQDVKQRIEDVKLYEWQHAIRNNIAPFFTERGFEGPFPAPTGMRWTFNPVTGKAWLVERYGVDRWSMPGLRRN